MSTVNPQETELEFIASVMEQNSSPQVVTGSDKNGHAYRINYEKEVGNGNGDRQSNGHPQARGERPPLSVEPKRYRLAEFARKFNFTPQYVIHLITRYGLISPAKTAEPEGKETYLFTEYEEKKLERFKELTRRGISVQDAALMIKQEDSYHRAAEELIQVVVEGAQHRSPKTWEQAIAAICKSPLLDESERTAFLLVEGHGRSLGQCILDLEVASEKEVKTILHRAYSKVGFPLLYLLKLGLKA